ncbi:MAG: CvpA family protein [candidate division WOR-3 bacterium]|nr:CvpA family protein [candidate division WOR-3 bacterium]MCX7836450.1 CvpA family protein [candidate division WOR-3 bacterium]MDW8114205.1 CvpA family protein [candidate division WOR-3 bacterium]
MFLDILIVIILISGFFQGLKTGLIKSATSFLGIILGIFIANRFYPEISKYFGDTRIIRVISFIIIFLLVFFIFKFFGKVFSEILKVIFLSWFDKLAGGIWGIFATFVTIAFIIHLSLFFFPNLKKYYEKSKIAKRITLYWLRPRKSPIRNSYFYNNYEKLFFVRNFN